MTLAQVIQMVDDLKENAFSPEVKTAWLNDIEGMVQTQVMMVLPTDIITYAWATDQDKELLVKAPHSQIYWMYLSAMVDFANGEYDLYTNTMQMFNAKWRDFQAWFLRMYHPADEHEDVYRNETPETIGVFWRGYFLTAYGLAVKHGFRGNEDQWLQSLKAREIQMNYDAAKKWIQWRLEGDDPWIDLLDIGVLQQGVIDETLKDAQASKLAAEKAAQQAGAFQKGADQAKIAAQNAAALAEKSHHLAGECANAARDSAQQAENAKAGIVEAETRARQSAEAAAQKAQEAAASAQKAEQSAGAAHTHIADRDNPHGVTPQQIGAVTQEEFRRGLYGDIDCGGFEDALEAHAADRIAHPFLAVDGNEVSEAVRKSTTLEAHMHDPMAHPNIHLDGNMNEN